MISADEKTTKTNTRFSKNVHFTLSIDQIAVTEGTHQLPWRDLGSGLPFVRQISMSSTTFSFFNSCRIFISRMAVMGNWKDTRSRMNTCDWCQTVNQVKTLKLNIHVGCLYVCLFACCRCCFYKPYCNLNPYCNWLFLFTFFLIQLIYINHFTK